jgi:hypothetical protein
VKQLHGRARRRASMVACAALVGAATVIGATGPVAVNAKMGGPVRFSYKLGQGLKLTTIRYPNAPEQVRILTITQGAGSVTDMFTPTKQYPGYRKPSAMGLLGDASAMVNGDFAAPNGRPKHLSLVDGELWTSGIQDGAAIAFSGNGAHVYMGHPTLAMAAKTGGATIKIDRWNAGDPKTSQVAGFSQRGGRIEPPSGAASPTTADPRYCAARLIPTGGFEWTGTGKAGIARSFTVDAQPEPCVKTPISIGTDPGAVVLTGKNGGAGADAVKLLAAGEAIRLTWSFQGWPAVVDAIGAQPLLVQNGHNIAPPYHPGDSYFYNYNPRTSVGASEGCSDDRSATICKTYILTVDGRQSAWSKGMQLDDLADELIRAGATWAANLDGGGGTVMWVAKRDPAYCQTNVEAGGCLVNRPSERGGERVAVVSLGVKLAPDAGEPRAVRD